MVEQMMAVRHQPVQLAGIDVHHFHFPRAANSYKIPPFLRSLSLLADSIVFVLQFNSRNDS
jgi:hypothetical protein